MSGPFRLGPSYRDNLLEYLGSGEPAVLARVENLLTWYQTYTLAVRANRGEKSKGKRRGRRGLAGRLRTLSRTATQLHNAVWDFLNAEVPSPNFFFPDLVRLLRPTPGSPQGEGRPLGWQEFAAALFSLANDAAFYADEASHPGGKRGRGQPPATIRKFLAKRLVVLFLDHYCGEPDERVSNLEDFVAACFNAARIRIPVDRFEREWIAPVLEEYDRDPAALDHLRA